MSAYHDFTGTFGAFLHVHGARKRLLDVVQSHIAPEDYLYHAQISKMDPKLIKDAPHITLAMGMSASECPPAVWSKLKHEQPHTIVTTKLGVFSNEPKGDTLPGWDVLYASVDDCDGNKWVYDSHSKLHEFFGLPERFDGYHPHITIAYLKQGTGAKYASLPIATELCACVVTWKRYRDKWEWPLHYQLAWETVDNVFKVRVTLPADLLRFIDEAESKRSIVRQAEHSIVLFSHYPNAFHHAVRLLASNIENDASALVAFENEPYCEDGTWFVDVDTQLLYDVVRQLIFSIPNRYPLKDGEICLRVILFCEDSPKSGL